MNVCPRHGPLPPDWDNCAYCLREKNAMGGPPPAAAAYPGTPGATMPPPPRGFGAYEPPSGADDTRFNAGGAAVYGAWGAGGGDSGGGGETRYNPGPAAGGTSAGNWGNGVDPGATHFAAGDVAGFSSGGSQTRIVDPPPLAKRRVRAWLMEKDGPRPDRVYQLRDGETWIGRDLRNDIVLDDDAVSSQHAKLWVDDDRLIRVINVLTSNGTHVNGNRIDGSVALWENDELRVGTVVLVLKRLDEPPRPGAARPAAAPPGWSPAPTTPPAVGGTGAAVPPVLGDWVPAPPASPAPPPPSPAPRSYTPAAPAPPLLTPESRPAGGLAGAADETWSAPQATTKPRNLEETWSVPPPPSAVADTLVARRPDLPDR